MNTIELGGQTYRVSKMPPREQLHVSRRLTPILATVGHAALGLLDGSRSKEEVMQLMVEAVGPLSRALADVADADLDYVLDHCLVRVERKNAGTGTWHPAYVKGSGELLGMFQDVDLAMELRLAAEVLRVNMAGFFGALSGEPASSLSASTGAAGRA